MHRNSCINVICKRTFRLKILIFEVVVHPGRESVFYSVLRMEKKAFEDSFFVWLSRIVIFPSLFQLSWGTPKLLTFIATKIVGLSGQEVDLFRSDYCPKLLFVSTFTSNPTINISLTLCSPSLSLSLSLTHTYTYTYNTHT